MALHPTHSRSCHVYDDYSDCSCGLISWERRNEEKIARIAQLEGSLRSASDYERKLEKKLRERDAHIEGLKAELRTTNELRLRDLHVAVTRIAALEALIAKGLIAFEHTREYLGPEKLPALPGWSWFDWTREAFVMLGHSDLLATKDINDD